MNLAKEHSDLKGFYEIPGIPFLYISKEGVCWDEYIKEYVRPKYGLSPYPELKPKGLTKPISIHRALALTFLECPGDPKQYQVDHIDGNKDNYKLENLRWVTRSENAISALRNGFRRDNRPVLLKDLRTDEVKRFYGVNECARYLGIHPGYISTYTKRKQIAPFKEFYDLIKEGDEWNGFCKKDIGKHNLAKAREVVGVDKDLNVFIFGSISRASEYTKVSHSEIVKLCDSKTGIEKNGYSFRYLKDFMGSLENAKRLEAKYTEHLSKHRFVSTSKPIVVEDKNTGEKKEWMSLREFSDSIGMNKKTIQKSMLLNSGWYKNYLIRYI